MYNHPPNRTQSWQYVQHLQTRNSLQHKLNAIELPLAITAAKAKTHTEKLRDQMDSDMAVLLQHFHCLTYVTLIASQQARKLTKPKCFLHLREHIRYAELKTIIFTLHALCKNFPIQLENEQGPTKVFTKNIGLNHVGNFTVIKLFLLPFLVRTSSKSPQVTK